MLKTLSQSSGQIPSAKVVLVSLFEAMPFASSLLKILQACLQSARVCTVQKESIVVIGHLSSRETLLCVI